MKKLTRRGDAQGDSTAKPAESSENTQISSKTSEIAQIKLRKSVISYIVTFFAAVLLLIMLSYFVQHRRAAAGNVPGGALSGEQTGETASRLT